MLPCCFNLLFNVTFVSIFIAKKFTLLVKQNLYEVLKVRLKLLKNKLKFFMRPLSVHVLKDNTSL